MRHDQLTCSAVPIELLASASLATVERNLHELRLVLVGGRMSQTKPGGLLRREIPVVVGGWRHLDTPGHLEIDLVSHSGEVATGEWIWTLCATDLSTGWTERMGSSAQLEWLDALCSELPCPDNRCLQPVTKVTGKEAVGNRARRQYDRPPPLKGMLASGRADAAKIPELLALYTTASPLTLKRQIDRRLAAMPAALGVFHSA